MIPPTDTRTAKHKLIDRILIDKGFAPLADTYAAYRALGWSRRQCAETITADTGELVTITSLVEWLETEAGQ